MAVEAQNLHILASQILMDREIGMKISGTVDVAGEFAGAATVVGKKRIREGPVWFYGEPPSTFFQQNLFHEHLFIYQTQRRQAEAAFADRRRLIALQVEEAIENEVKKRVKTIDVELESAKKMNWDLEERLRTLAVENQLWRELAQSNELTANLLRADLEHVITAQICADGDPPQCGGYDVDDGESCCGDNEEPGENPTPPHAPARVCRSCARKEPTVLLLPCRHLCLCGGCGQATTSCPICKCFINGTVNVNLS